MVRYSTPRAGTAGYKLTLVVLEGEHAGRRFWHDIWLSEAAISLAKRDLGKLGVTSLEQLERPLPEGIIVTAKVALRRGDRRRGIQPRHSLRCRAASSPPRPSPSPRRRPASPKPEQSEADLDEDGFDWRTGEQQDLTASSRGQGAQRPTMTSTPFGFRVVGHRAEKRRLVDWRAAFAGYASCDPKAELDREAFLSHFIFGQDFVDFLEREGSEKGYSGPCGAHWLFWDIDRPDDLALALRDARRLAGAILERYRELDDDDLLIFLSGGKGVHVGIPTAWHPEPSPDFNAIAKLFCLAIAEAAERRGRWVDLLEDPALPRAELQAPEDRALQAPAHARRADAS